VAREQAVAEPSFIVGDPMPHLEFHHLATTASLIELERAIEDVWRFLIVVEHEVSADGADPSGERDAEPPSRGVDLVDPLVAKVAISRVPYPVPVVVKPVATEWLHRRRTCPEVVIDARWNGFGGRVANRVSPLETQAARQIDLAKRPSAKMAD